MASRSLNSSRNAVSGIVKVIAKIALPFVIRTVMLYFLGKEYLGLNSLFTSILSVLNLAELGFSSAVVFRLYEPFANNEKDTVGAYLNYLKRMYQIIGIIVFGAGLCIMPFLSLLIKGSYPNDINLYVLYLIYLINTSISFFFAGYKRALIIAAQRMDYINVVETALLCLQYLLQIAALIIFKNYYVFIVIMPVATVLINLMISYICKTKYADYFSKNLLPRDKQKGMLSDVKWVAVYRISEVSRNSFDSIVVSSVLGLTAVAIYNNYYYIFSALYSFMVIINQSLQASVGNSIAKESAEKNERDMYKFSVFSLWIICFCCVCLLCLYQPFMTLWMGVDMLLPTKDMVLFVVYFYVLNMSNIRNLYFDGNGLWKRGAATFILESVLNLVLNIALGKVLGISGVIIATIITMFACSFVCRSKILYSKYFKKNTNKFFAMHLKLFLICTCVSFLCYYLCSLCGSAGVKVLLIRALICCVIPNGVYFIIFRNNPVFTEGVQQLKMALLHVKHTSKE